MIILISGDAALERKLAAKLSGDLPGLRRCDWDKLDLTGYIYVVDTPPRNANQRALLDFLLEQGRDVIWLNSNLPEELSGDSLLLLPPGCALTVLVSVIHWLCGQYTIQNRFHKLQTIIEHSFLHVIWLDQEGGIQAAYIPKMSSMQLETFRLKGKSFQEVFGFSHLNIPDQGDASNKIRHFITKSEERIPFVAEKINISAVPELSWYKKEEGWLVLLNTVKEIRNLEESIKEFAAAQSKLAKQRNVELELANELLNSQTRELRKTNALLEEKNKQLLDELTFASELQKSLLPTHFPTGIPISIARKYIPYLLVGGDFFDIIMLNNSNLGIILSDVSGHGVAAAFLTSMLKGAFSHFAPLSLSPAETLARINREFTKSLTTEHYLTAFYLILNTDTLECTFCNAGHPHQLLFKRSGESEELHTNGFLLGMLEGVPYEDKIITLSPGDRLCLFTDGITEAVDEHSDQFGRERIVQIVQEHSTEEIEELSNLLISEVLSFSAKPSFDDDITVLLIEVIENL